MVKILLIFFSVLIITVLKYGIVNCQQKFQCPSSSNKRDTSSLDFFVFVNKAHVLFALWMLSRKFPNLTNARNSWKLLPDIKISLRENYIFEPMYIKTWHKLVNNLHLTIMKHTCFITQLNNYKNLGRF